MTTERPERKGFRSDLEWLIAVDLWERGIEYEYETTVLDYTSDVYRGLCDTCGSTHVRSQHTYTPDFILPNGIMVEAKGKFLPENRTIMEDVVRDNPDKDIRMLFQRNNFLTKKKSMTYGRWCDLKGIKWAVGRVPEEWLYESI